MIPTPFRDGAFDPASFGRMVERMTGHLDGYTLLGSTGEAPSMTTAERMAIVEQALAMTPAEMTVVVGVTHTSVADSVALARHAEEHGATGVMCAMPYYFANVPDGMLAYLQQIDQAIGIDLVLYDNPVASRTVLAADTVLRFGGRARPPDDGQADRPRPRQGAALAGGGPVGAGRRRPDHLPLPGGRAWTARW